MDKKESEPSEYPQVKYTKYGEIYVEAGDLLRSKAGRRLLDSVNNMKIHREPKSNLSD